jgi:hypothetical protein
LVLGQEFQDALSAHAELLFTKPDTGRFAENWEAVPALLKSEGQAVLIQRLWNAFNSENGRVVGVIPYYGEMLSATVRKNGPEAAFNRIVQIIIEHEVSEINWLMGTLSRWTPRTKEAKAIQSDWRIRAEKLLGGENESLTEEERSALTALREVLTPKSRPSKSS